jgi:hypothetical protein
MRAVYWHEWTLKLKDKTQDIRYIFEDNFNFDSLLDLLRLLAEG